LIYLFIILFFFAFRIGW